MGYKTSNLIEKIEKGKFPGVLYGAVDIPDGEHTPEEINNRTAARGAAFAKEYQTTGMGAGDKAPISTDTAPAVKEN